MDDKSKLFAFRPGALLLNKLEQVKNALGISPSDVARQALDKGLESILQAQAGALDDEAFDQLKCNVRGSLLRLIEKEKGQNELSRAEWRFVANMCYRTYDRLFHQLEVIDRELVIANMRSFAAVMKLRDEQYPRLAEAGGDDYYYGNMGFSWAPHDATKHNIQSHVEACIKGLPLRPSVGSAAFPSRNFDVALRDEPAFDTSRLNSALRPYLKSLLLVCLRGYWHENKIPIVTPEDTFDGWRKSEEEQSMPNSIPMKSVSNEHFVLCPHASSASIGAAIEARHHPFVFTLNDFVELTGFIALVERVEREKNHCSIPGFELSAIDFSAKKDNPRYMLATGRWRHFFKPDEFEALKNILNEFIENPVAKVHFERLEMIYGRV